MYAGAHFRAVAARTQEWITRSRDALHLLVAELTYKALPRYLPSGEPPAGEPPGVLRDTGANARRL